MNKEEILEKNRNTKKTKLIISMSIIILILLVAIFLIIHYFTNPVIKFKKSLETNDVATMKKIYNNTDDNNDKKNIEKIFVENLSSILDNYIDDKLDYENALNEIEQYNDIKGFSSYVNSSKKDLENIKKSKDTFLLGKDCESNNDILNAIKYYSEVISLDKNNYQIAQNYIITNSDKLKNSTFDEINNLISNNNYISANEKLEELKQVFNNDDEIIKKSNEIKEKVKEQQIQEYKENQEVTVESVKTYQAWYSDTTDGISVVIKNNTNKVIKDYSVGILAYDSNGYPLEIEYNSYLKLGKQTAANVQPNATFGKENYFYIHYEEEKIKIPIACVVEVEYYDGSTWENPYYEYWLEQYKGKPLEN